MKFTDVIPGTTYLYDTSNDWADTTNTHASYRRFPVRIDDTTRYDYSDTYVYARHETPDQRARKDPKGDHLRGVRPGNPDSEYESDREDQVTYVRPRYLRTTWDEAVKLAAANRAQRQADRVADRKATDEAFHQAQALRDRLDSLGVTGVRVSSTEAFHGFRNSNAEVKVNITPDALAELLDRLEAAQALAADHTDGLGG
jgi:hypothetical protein